MQDQNIKVFAGGGMDTDSAPQFVATNDWIDAFNCRITGTGQGEESVLTNIDSNDLIAGTRSAGINQCIGAQGFESIRKAIGFIFNSGGYHQIVQYDIDTDTQTTLYTDITDSGGEVLLPLDPQNFVNCVLINNTYIIFWANDLEVGYFNLETLQMGGYGTLLWEDLSLLKPQCMEPPTGTYGSDTGVPANYLFGKLPQFAVQYVNADFNYSAWSTRSKRIVPYQQNTPVLGSDVTQNNYIVVSVNIGTKSTQTINIACRFGKDIYNIVKSVDRDYVLALPETAVDVPALVYEAYDPTTNIYQFAFYNNEVGVPVAPTETDLFYDYIYPSNAGEKVNGNIMALADWKLLYERPTIDVNISAVGYDPNIDIPAEEYENSMRTNGSSFEPDTNFPFNHKFKITLNFAGYPRENDEIIVVTSDVRNAQLTHSYSYIVPASQEGNLGAVTASFSLVLASGSNWYDNGDGTFTIRFLPAEEYYGLQRFSIKLAFAGAAVSNSIPAVLDNAPYQLALSFRDYKSRPFPLTTDNIYKVTTPSYAQIDGNAVQINWQINSAPPTGAVDAQWLITKPQINSMLDVLGTPLVYKGTWNAYTNSPTLAVNVGTVGDTYQITTPASPADPTNYTNLGNGLSYDTGDYVTYNGQYWDVIPKEFGDLTSGGNILAINLNPLRLFNDEYADAGVSTILSYDYSVGDRCTLHYYIDGIVNTYINNPCVNLSVFGYDAGSYLAKVEKPANFDLADIAGKNVFLRLYTPALANQSASDTQDQTVWYEIGERITITDGAFDQTSGVITDGGVYYKSRQFADAVDPYGDPPIQTLATDLNYSDFYPSAFSSFGRPRTYYDVLEPTEQLANIIPSQKYVVGSRINGLNRFYPENIYGNGDGETSASHGAIQVMWQRGNILLVFQKYNIGYVPVNISVIEDEIQQQQIAISQKLFNTCRYERGDIAIGVAKESFAFYNNTAFFVDSNRCEPCHATTGGVFPISGKMSKFFKLVLQSAFDNYQKVTSYYDRFNNEWVVTIQSANGVVISFAFNELNWQVNEDYTIVPADVTATTDGAHCTVSYNSGTGIATYTPTTDYVGSDTATFTFDTDDGPVTKNVCLSWTSGGEDVTPFFFGALTGQLLSTLLTSNTVLIGGIDVPVPISISAGQYSINGGAWTSTAGTVVNGDLVQVRQTSSGSEETETTITLTVSTYDADFSVTTGTTVVEPFVFTDLTNQPTSTLIESNEITVEGGTIPVAISITGGEYSKNGGAYTSVAGTATQGDTVRVRQTSSASGSTTTDVVLTISSTSDTWSVTTASAGDGYIELTVDNLSYGYFIDGITGTGLPAGIDTADVSPGDTKFFAFSGTIVIQTLDVEITVSTPLPNTEISVYYSSDASTFHYPIYDSGVYEIPWLQDVTDPAYVIISINPE